MILSGVRIRGETHGSSSARLKHFSEKKILTLRSLIYEPVHVSLESYC